MLHEVSERLICTLPTTARVVDVGGGASPFPRADYVIDALQFAQAGAGSSDQVHLTARLPARYSRQTWTELDLCDHTPWPFPDKFFDYAVCSHLLEDVRDPVWVCQEMMRIAKAGYVETPSRIVEQSLGVEHPRMAGYYHHRWLVEADGNTLSFRLKPHNLHVHRRGIVAKLTANRMIAPQYAYMQFEWQNTFEATEILQFDEGTMLGELSSFAERHRHIPGLVVPAPSMNSRDRWRRRIYFARLRLTT